MLDEIIYEAYDPSGLEFEEWIETIGFRSIPVTWEIDDTPILIDKR